MIFPANYPGRIVKHPNQGKAQLFKGHMPGNGPSQIACSTKMQGWRLWMPNIFFNFLAELRDVIPISLLAKAAEAVKVLPDLRRL